MNIHPNIHLNLHISPAEFKLITKALTGALSGPEEVEALKLGQDMLQVHAKALEERLDVARGACERAQKPS